MNPKKKKKSGLSGVRWALRMLTLSFSITIVLMLISSKALEGAGLVLSLVVLSTFVLLGVAFDMFGIAVATASERPFHSMASRHINGAAESLRFIRSADKVTSFCNDVVGDICGIVSGTCSAVIVTLLAASFNSTITALVVSGLLAGLTVGGKALGKSSAIRHNTQIVLFVGRLMYAFKCIAGKFRR